MIQEDQGQVELHYVGLDQWGRDVCIALLDVKISDMEEQVDRVKRLRARLLQVPDGMPLSAKEVRDRVRRPAPPGKKATPQKQQTKKKAEKEKEVPDEDEFDTVAAADFLGTTTGNLSVLRSTKKGPAFRKIGKKVYYRERDLEAFKDKVRSGGRKKPNGSRALLELREEGDIDLEMADADF